MDTDYNGYLLVIRILAPGRCGIPIDHVIPLCIVMGQFSVWPQLNVSICLCQLS